MIHVCATCLEVAPVSLPTTTLQRDVNNLFAVYRYPLIPRNLCWSAIVLDAATRASAACHMLFFYLIYDCRRVLQLVVDSWSYSGISMDIFPRGRF